MPFDVFLGIARFFRVVPLVGVVAMATGCGGGGGGGSAAGNLGSPIVIVTPVEESREIATDYSVAAMAQTHIDAINYDVNAGRAGKGVKVAFQEDGVDTSHPGLSGLTVETPQMFSDTNPNRIEHGTMVALLIGGRMGKEVYGSAYESDLEFVCCVEYDRSSTVEDLLVGIGYLADQSEAFAVNFSFSSLPVERVFSGYDRDRCLAFFSLNQSLCDNPIGFVVPGRLPLIPQNIQNLPFRTCVDPGKVEERHRLCVFGAGNEGFHSEGTVRLTSGYPVSVEDMLDPAMGLPGEIRQWFENNLYERNDFSGLPLLDRRLEGSFLVVAALADEDSLADYSNGCGKVKHVCLSALGDIPFDICSVLLYSSGICPGLMQGSSFSTPLVTGAAAVLKSTYPNLNAPTVSTILLTSAFDLGDPGVDEDFGWGRLDLGKALMPAGAQSSSAGTRLADTHVRAGFSMDAALAVSTVAFGMFDMHGRPYLHFVASRMSSPQIDPELSLENWRLSSAALMEMDLGARMGLSGPQRGSALPNMLGLAGFPGWEMGLEQCHLSCPSRRDVQVGSLVPSSALAWTQRHMQVPGGRMGLVLETGLKEGSGMTYTNRGLFVESGLSEGLLRIEAGMLYEKDTFMGGEFSGALDVHPGDSQYVSASIGVPVGENAFSAGYTLGKAKSGLAANSYVIEIDDVSYDAYRLAFGGERWELGYTVPLAATKGGMRVESIGGYTGSEGDWSVVETDDGVMVLGEASAEDWSYRTDSHWVDLGAGNRERRLGLTMARPYGSWEMTFAVEHVANSPRRSFAGDEARVAVALSLIQ